MVICAKDRPFGFGHDANVGRENLKGFRSAVERDDNGAVTQFRYRACGAWKEGGVRLAN